MNTSNILKKVFIALLLVLGIFVFTSCGDNTTQTSTPPSSQLSLSLNPTTLSGGTQGTPYSQSVLMSATGGTSPYTFTCSGSGIAGLTVAASEAVCTISGTPTAAGTFTVSFGVNDSAGGTASSTLSFSVSASTTPPAFSGNWSGTWVDTRYNVSGNISAVLTQNTTTISGTGVIDLSALGLGNQTGTASGTITGNTITFSFNAANVGSGSGTLVGNNGSGTGTVVAPLNFGAFTFSGTASNTVISGTFNFTSPTGGHGTINMTKQ